MKVLFTGFEPKSANEDSPSWDWISRASELATENCSVEALQLTGTWDGCFSPLRAALRRDWDAVICVGSRAVSGVAIERLALK